MPTAGAFVIQKSDWAGTAPVTLEWASFMPSGSEIVDTLNQPSTFSFAMATDDSDAADINLWSTVIIVLYEGSSRKFRGPVVAIEDSFDNGIGVTTFHCADPSVMFQFLYLDRGAGRKDYLETTGQFEQGAEGDPPFGWTDVEDATSTIHIAVPDTPTAGDAVSGNNSLRIDYPQPAPPPPDIPWSYTKASVFINGGGGGELVTVAAWFKIPSATFIEPNQFAYGLIVQQLDADTGDPVEDADQAFRGNETLIDADTPRDKWIRVETTTWVRPFQAAEIQVQLWPVAGTILWDAVTVTKMESLSLLNADQAEICHQIVVFAQNPAYGKAPLHLTYDCPLTGVLRDRTYQYADHVSVYSALSEFPGLGNGLDYWVDADGVFHTRYFDDETGLVAGFRRGDDRTGTVTLTVDADDGSADNCVLRRVTEDGTQAASQVVQLGGGDGPDREEGAASDPTAFDGILIQKIIPASGNPSINTLGETAGQELLVAKDPIVYELTIIDSDLTNTLGLGDRCASAINAGRVQETRDLRVVSISRDPITGTITVSCNPAFTPAATGDSGAGDGGASGGDDGSGGSSGNGGGPEGSGRRFAFKYGASPENVAAVEAEFGPSGGVLIHSRRGDLSTLFTMHQVVSPWFGSGRKVSITTCILPNTGDAAANYAAAIAGDYDAAWHDMCSKIVSYGFPDAILRPLHEFNLSYIGEWAVVDSDATTVLVSTSDYKEVFRRFVGIAREHSTQFRFDWCWLIGGNIDVLSYYPGDAYVDICGIDVYDRKDWGVSVSDRWDTMVALAWGLQDHLDFVTDRGLLGSFPEMGPANYPDSPSSSGGDNDLFEGNMLDWQETNAWEYWTQYQDGPPVESDVQDGNFEDCRAVLHTYLGV